MSNQSSMVLAGELMVTRLAACRAELDRVEKRFASVGPPLTTEADCSAEEAAYQAAQETYTAANAAVTAATEIRDAALIALNVACDILFNCHNS